MANRLFAVIFLLLAAIAFCAAAAPAAPTAPTANSTVATVQSPPASNNATEQDYADYEIPEDLAPGGVTVVEDYIPLTPGAGDNAHSSDKLAQPESEQSYGKDPNPNPNLKNSAVAVVTSVFSIFSVTVAVGLILNS